ncbi:extensin family protein [bacterium]|nr:extensin family protein [bacterium]
MIKVSEIKGIHLAYDRLKPGDYGTAQPPYSFKMESDLKIALEHCVDRLVVMGWANDIDTILSAGAYVNKAGAHSRGIAIDLDGVVLKNGTVLTAKSAPEAPYWRFAAMLALEFGVVLHRMYNPQHADHFHVDLSRIVEWGGAKSQVQLIQAILNSHFGYSLAVNGSLGFATLGFWSTVIGEQITDASSAFLKILNMVVEHG